jgi:hypothetical protein
MTPWLSFTISCVRALLASIGRMRSTVPCTTSLGTSIIRKSSRKSVCQVRGQAQVAIGEAPAEAFSCL